MPITIGDGLSFCGSLVLRGPNWQRPSVNCWNGVAPTEGSKPASVICSCGNCTAAASLADRPAAESPPYTPGETYFTASPIAQIAPRPARSVSAHPTATDPGRLFREYLDRHHYLGYRAPYGAQLRYWVRPAQP